MTLKENLEKLLKRDYEISKKVYDEIKFSLETVRVAYQASIESIKDRYRIRRKWKR